jgi:predicted RNA-binding protein YlxR (DUF448 family)
MSDHAVKLRRCIFCGRHESENVKTDHLRIVLFDEGKLKKIGDYFYPLLKMSEWELRKLKEAGGGEQPICLDRRKCKKRRLPNV